MDRDIYKQTMQLTLQGKNPDFENLEAIRNLTIVESSVHDLVLSGRQCTGIRLGDGTELKADSVILTTGTFLGGRVHIGRKSREAGRFMRSNKVIDDDEDEVLEPPSNAMAESIRRLGMPVDRQRTGTPPRLHIDSIDFTGMEAQVSDDPPQFFSYVHEF